MPYVTRTSTQGQLYVQTTTPQELTTGTLWADTSTSASPVLKIANGSAYSSVKGTYSTAAVVSQSTTIGDYTTPTSATSSSTDTDYSASTLNFNTSGTTLLVNVYAGQPRGGQRITDTTFQGGTATNVKFHLKKTGSPTGTGSCKIRKTSDDSVVATSSTIDVSTIAGVQTEYTFTFAGETLPSEEFYVLFEYSGGSAGNEIAMYGQDGGSTATGSLFSFYDTSYHDSSTNDCRGSFTGTALTASYPASQVRDGNTTTRATTNAENNPYIYLDMGSALNLCAVALYYDGTNTTETQVKLQVSTDANTWTDKRTINTSAFTNGAYNYCRFNIAGGYRYLRIYGNSGTSKVLSIYEAKVMTKTDAQIFADLGILEISTSDTSLDLDGT